MNSSAPSAERVADLLAFEFMQRGSFSAAAGPIEAGELFPQSVLRAAHRTTNDAFAEDETEAFSNLSVQSVGFEEGSEDPKVHIYVNKGSAKALKLLPDSVDSVKVVIHRTSSLLIRPEAASTRMNKGHIFTRNGAICCGTSCAPTSEQLSGTIGAIVRLTDGGQICLLSNNHVFSGCNHTPPNQPILAPSNSDGRPNAPAPREVGRHHAMIELRSGDPNYVDPCELDLGLIKATHLDRISSWQGDDADGFDTPGQISSPLSMMRVKKFGRTTGLTFGTVEARSKRFTPIEYTTKAFKGIVWFKDIWTVRSDQGDVFAAGGDSGSLVVTEDGSEAVGILFAANTRGEYGWILPMPKVMAAFGGLEVVNGHNV